MNVNEITTVKIQGAGYLVNGTLCVPAAEGNRHYAAVQAWIALGNTPAPEFTQAELNAQTVSDAKATRDANEVAPVDVVLNSTTYSFDANQRSLDRMREAIESFPVVESKARELGYAGPVGTIEWTLADNTPLQVTASDLQAVRDAIAVRGLVEHVTYSVVKAANL